MSTKEEISDRNRRAYLRRMNKAAGIITSADRHLEDTRTIYKFPRASKGLEVEPRIPKEIPTGLQFTFKEDWIEDRHDEAEVRAIIERGRN